MEREPEEELPEELRKTFDPPELHEGHKLSRVPLSDS